MIAALDIGGTKIAAGLVDAGGHVLAADVIPTVPEAGFADALVRMAALIGRVAGDRLAEVEGIGIGCTGPVNPEAGSVGDAALLPGWQDAPIAAALAAEFRVPAAMENDADAVALAEVQWGAGRTAECLLYVTVGTGIGAGMVRRGELYRGARGGHPEIGHTALDLSSGPKCYCGLTGCWESLASGPALQARYLESGGGVAGGEEICRRARAGEERARTAVLRTARYLGLGLVNAITAYCPDQVLLGGGLLQAADLFLPEVRAIVQKGVTQVPAPALGVDAVPPHRHAALQGAAAVWLHRYRRELP